MLSLIFIIDNLSFFYLLVIVALLFSLSASEYDFKLDGVGYSIVSLSDLTCVVVECDELEVLSIPGEVFYKNKKLHNFKFHIPTKE